MHGYNGDVDWRESKYENTLLFTLALTPLVYSPRFWDPSVFPKVAFFTLMVFALIPFIANSIQKQSRENRNTKIISWILLFLLLLGLILTLLSQDLYAGFFGVTTRNNGFFGFHTCLCMILAGIAVHRKTFIRKLLWIISCVGLIETLIAIAQKQGFVLIIAKNPYSPLIGTFGNPNYLSAYLGFSTLALLLLAIMEMRIWVRSLLIFNIVLSLLVLFWSQSVQGLFMFAIGSAFLFTKWISSIASRAVNGIWRLLLTLVSIMTVFGLVDKGPLRRLLFQDSTFYRLDYWRAAIRMMVSKPLLGVGPDQYQHAYITYRDARSVTRETNIVSDSAHNMYLQVGATYGLAYLTLFLVLVIYLTLVGLRLPTKSHSGAWNWNSLSVVTLWIAFLFQAAISVDTVSALSLGFLSGGLVIRSNLIDGNTKAEGKKSKTPNVLPTKIQLPVLLVSIFLAILILFPPFTFLKYLSFIRDSYSAPGTKISLTEINNDLRFSASIGHGDRYLWSRIATFRYGAGDVKETSKLLNQLELYFPNYPTIKDYQAQLAANENRLQDALRYRQAILEIDPMNILNLKEAILLTKKLQLINLYDEYMAKGKRINLDFFSSPDLKW